MSHTQLRLTNHEAWYYLAVRLSIQALRKCSIIWEKHLLIETSLLYLDYYTLQSLAVSISVTPIDTLTSIYCQHFYKKWSFYIEMGDRASGKAEYVVHFVNGVINI